jgi:hypothetical protein
MLYDVKNRLEARMINPMTHFCTLNSPFFLVHYLQLFSTSNLKYWK